MCSIESNRCAVSVGPKKFEIQDRPLPEDPLQPTEVLVKVIATGICGSDAHLWEVGTPKPLALGHESVGIIIEVGSNVKDRKIGDRVAIEPRQSCHECYFCKRGHPNTCTNFTHCSTPPTEGSLCQYFRCKFARAVPIGDKISWEVAGCIQPLAVTVQLCRKAKLRPHQTVAVFGCGPLGLLVMAVAKAYGARRVIAFDIEQSRVDFATKHYADIGVLCPKDSSQDPEAFAKQFLTSKLKETGLEMGFDVAFEVTGAESAAMMAIYALRAQGTYVQAGLHWKPPRMPMLWVVAKELKIVGSVSYGWGCFEEAIDLIDRKLVDLSPMITATYPLTQSQQAFEAQARREDIKIIIMNQQ
ncbi:uncharacterized protein PV09_07444 [Verruconis gallopava]|uniref:D-xylulose reductase n=1 Tax=Verruconis gallopava TaxID=253628 RepID=A0A0D2A306_9PEZI|nr:uncharacterized protein PV09_07444 [Verruconis gallopava]KIW01158.1 hypothetical protein PV09_07444 [Verruconis gallopava]